MLATQPNSVCCHHSKTGSALTQHTVEKSKNLMQAVEMKSDLSWLIFILCLPSD
jgi:hypothetical protein